MAFLRKLVWALLCIGLMVSAGFAAQPRPVAITDDLEREVRLENIPQRIVSLAPSNAEILFALGVGDKVIAGILACVLGITTMAACIVSWWHERLATVLLFVTALGFGIHIGVYPGRNHFLAWLMVGMPYLIAGNLFFLSWWMEQKQPKTGTNQPTQPISQLP